MDLSNFFMPERPGAIPNLPSRTDTSELSIPRIVRCKIAGRYQDEEGFRNRCDVGSLGYEQGRDVICTGGETHMQHVCRFIHNFSRQLVRGFELLEGYCGDSSIQEIEFQEVVRSG